MILLDTHAVVWWYGAADRFLYATALECGVPL